ncbi:hypothetical protein KOM00_20130 [Geomonas sp. Red69]|uniref:hypothetical protein n=1 Tax=Geomonas diazotrophica TaxID=2843197 RepID=UPI001C1084A7|nr:hypothetical protein [Geomonas diazotrophica]MBU5639033.1 hypothetical protein [Geomonas diazotrophica]
MKRILKSRCRLVLTLCVILFLPVKGSCETRSLEFLKGTWQVTGVRLDETLMRTPHYNYNDQDLMGNVISFSAKMVQSRMPEAISCRGPIVSTETMTLEALLDRTMIPKENVSTRKNRFALPVDTTKKIDVLWIKCQQGHLGPDTPRGPEGYNWIAKLSKMKIAMRWYDNTILLLKRKSN